MRRDWDKKKARRFGEAIYGPAYTDSNGVTLYWNDALKVYEMRPPSGDVPAEQAAASESQAVPTNGFKNESPVAGGVARLGAPQSARRLLPSTRGGEERQDPERRRKSWRQCRR